MPPRTGPQQAPQYAPQPQQGHPYAPPATGPQAPQGHPAPPPLYRPEEGWGGAGFALPEEYREPHGDHPVKPQKRWFPKVGRPVRIAALAVTLVVSVGVAVGMPYREDNSDYQKQKRIALAYTTVPHRKVGTIAGTRFVLGSVGPADISISANAPSGTKGVKAIIGFKSPTQATLNRMNYLEYVFQDDKGRVWQPTSSLSGNIGVPTPGKVNTVTIQTLVPKDLFSRVRVVVRPKQVLDYQSDNPTQAVTDPALVFQR